MKAQTQLTDTIGNVSTKNKLLRRKGGLIPQARWAAYAVAGAATALAGSNSAEADIHYSGPLHVFFNSFHEDQHTTLRFPLDQPGDSFVLRHYLDSYTRVIDDFGISGIASAAARGYVKSPFFLSFVSKLPFGQRISAGPFINNGGGILYFGPSFGGTEWRSPGSGFIGFRFNNGSGVQYGWARIKIERRRGGAAPFELIDYAYADPGESITAGQMSSDNDAVNENSLGGLALGAVGLLAWRKSRSRAAR